MPHAMIRVSRAAPTGNTNWLVEWCKGEDVFVVAGGSSLKDFDFSKLKGRRVVAVNRSIYKVDADIVCFLDAEMAAEFRKKFPDFPDGWKTRIVAGHYGGVYPSRNVTVVRISNMMPRAASPHGPMVGRASSAQLGISCAIVGGARKIYLLGVDGDSNGHNTPHPNDAKSKEWHKAQYGRIASSFSAFEPWKSMIVNLNKKSNVKVFPFGDVDEVLA
jgi:hypothetical protein